MNEDVLALVEGRRGHFQLESGHHGDLWLPLERLCLHAREIQPFVVRLAAALRRYRVEVVCGPLVEGAYVGLLVSLELGCDFVYAERFANPARAGLFPVEYRLPKALHDVSVSGAEDKERFLSTQADHFAGAKMERKSVGLLCSK